jgi:hypothetical protein
VRSIDLLPTLSAFASPSAPGETPGMPIVRADGSVAPGAPDPALASTQFDRREVDAIVLPPWKVIVPPPGARRGPEVYDLERDPGEHQDVAAERPVLVGYARQQIAAAKMRVPAMAPATSEPPVDPGVMDRLRSLGYVVD